VRLSAFRPIAVLKSADTHSFQRLGQSLFAYYETLKLLLKWNGACIRTLFIGPHVSNNALKQIIDLQRSLYDRALAEARELSGASSDNMNRYHREFSSSLPNDFKYTAPGKILNAIDHNKVTLFGDFHSHKQNQRAFLRILRLYDMRPDRAPLIVCLEMFRSKDQNHVNAWMNELIGDQELLELTHYEKNWGFSWDNYKPILEFCRLRNIPVIGINSARAGKDTLTNRDAHTSKLMGKILKRNKNSKILCLIGEFHLADKHLPNFLSTQQLSTLRIFANLDKYFFSIQQKKLHQRDEYLELSNGTYCIINSPPWMKWHSQSLWEEIKKLGPIKYLQNSISSNDDDRFEFWDDETTDDDIDLDYHLKLLQKQITEFLKIPYKNSQLEVFSATHDQSALDLSHLTKIERETFLTRANEDGFAVDLLKKNVYMPEISTNHMAAAAGQMIFASFRDFERKNQDLDEAFSLSCLKFMFGFLANKILNPRVPLQNSKDLEAYVLSTKGKRKTLGSIEHRRNVAQSSLKAYYWLKDHWMGPTRINTPKLPKILILQNEKAADEICRTLGQIIADPLYTSLIRGKIDTVDLQKWLSYGSPTKKTPAKQILAGILTLLDQ
jgi:Haem-binding uptake, Tiki superfamily, ChaN